MSILVKQIAPSCYIYDENYRNLAAKHVLTAEGRAEWKGGLCPCGLTLNLRGNQNNDFAEYDVFSYIDTREMTNSFERCHATRITWADVLLYSTTHSRVQDACV